MRGTAVNLCAAGVVSGLLLAVVPASAQSLVRINVDFVGVASSQDSQEVVQRTTLFREISTGAVAYPVLPTVKGLKGGITFGRTFAVGVNLDFINYEQTAGLAISIPHPLFFNRPGTDVAVSEVLDRKDRNVDIRAVYIAPTPQEWSVQVFGGPTYLSVKEDRIGGILYNQSAPASGANNVTITSTLKDTVSGSTWGFNVGADVGYFFTRHVGLGGQVSANRGTVTLTDPFVDDDVDRSAGHVTFGGGLRLRF